MKQLRDKVVLKKNFPHNKSTRTYRKIIQNY